METSVNNKCRAFTSLEQSKKLSEILPLESADMIYMPMMDIDSMSNSGFFDIPECYPFNEFKDSNNKPLPCWSLAALLDVLPRVDIEKELWSSDKYDYRVKAYIGDGYVGDWFENPLDACYEMILKLNELKLL